jgi:hypothetical protein
VRRRHVSGPRFAASLDAGRHIQAIVVNWNRHEATSRRAQHVLREPISRFLNPHRASGVEQHPGRNIQRLLRAADDHDLAPLAAHRTCRSQISANRFSQFAETHGIAVLDRAQVKISAIARHELRPHVKRKGIHSRVAQTERSRAGHPRWPFIGRNQRTPLRHPAGHGSHTRGPGAAFFGRSYQAGQGTGHERSGTGVARKVALGEQLSVRVKHRNSGDAQLCSQGSGGGNALTGSQAPSHNGRTEGVVNLGIQRLRGGPIDGDQGGEAAGRLAHDSHHSGHNDVAASGYCSRPLSATN